MKGYKNCGERDVTYFGYGIVEYAGAVLVQYGKRKDKRNAHQTKNVQMLTFLYIMIKCKQIQQRFFKSIHQFRENPSYQFHMNIYDSLRMTMGLQILVKVHHNFFSQNVFMRNQ